MEESVSNKVRVYNFVVMPFDLAGAPGTFQRLMQEVFMEELDEFITAYLDDVLVFSRTWTEQTDTLELPLRS